MKPLQRYNVDTVFERTWNSDAWEERLEIEESDNGDWVRDADVKKLEEQNQMMLDALKGLCNGNWGCPCELSNEELAAWDKARVAITNVEGQQQ